MSTVTRPRGPLPSRVYWTRRVLVLAVLFALVFGIARLLGGSAGGDDTPSARPVGADASGTPDAPLVDDAASASPGGSKDDEGRDKARKKKPTPLPEPDGPCDDSDVLVTPKVVEAHAGSTTEIVLKLTTRKAAACTWEVSPDSVVLKLTSGIDPIWSSQECPQAIPTEAVVPRRKKADKVTVTWNGKRSDSECSAATDWAFPGWYHAEAVARGSVHPVDVQFELEGPVRATITPKPSPTPTPKDEKREKGKKKPAPTEGRQPTR